MHAVVVHVDIDATMAEGAAEFLHSKVVPMVSQLPGFVSGTWTRSATEGRSMLVFDSEDAAAAAAGTIRDAPRPDGLTLVSAGVFEVIAQA